MKQASVHILMCVAFLKYLFCVWTTHTKCVFEWPWVFEKGPDSEWHTGMPEDEYSMYTHMQQPFWLEANSWFSEIFSCLQFTLTMDTKGIHLKHETDLCWKATLNALPVNIQIETQWSGIIQKLEELHPCGSLFRQCYVIYALHMLPEKYVPFH